MSWYSRRPEVLCSNHRVVVSPVVSKCASLIRWPRGQWTAEEPQFRAPSIAHRQGLAVRGQRAMIALVSRSACEIAHVRCQGRERNRGMGQIRSNRWTCLSGSEGRMGNLMWRQCWQSSIRGVLAADAMAQSWAITFQELPTCVGTRGLRGGGCHHSTRTRSGARSVSMDSCSPLNARDGFTSITFRMMRLRRNRVW